MNTEALVEALRRRQRYEYRTALFSLPSRHPKLMATEINLKGLPVAVTISDPWDFVTEHRSGPFAAVVVAVGQDTWAPSRDSLLLKLVAPVNHGGTICEYLVAGERAEVDRFADLLSGKTVNCTLTGVSPDQALKGNPTDLSRWRGGIALIGSMRRAEMPASGSDRRSVR